MEVRGRARRDPGNFLQLSSAPPTTPNYTPETETRHVGDTEWTSDRWRYRDKGLVQGSAQQRRQASAAEQNAKHRNMARARAARTGRAKKQPRRTSNWAATDPAAETGPDSEDETSARTTRGKAAAGSKATQNLETRRCYNCDRIGHLTVDCWRPRRQTGPERGGRRVDNRPTSGFGLGGWNGGRNDNRNHNQNSPRNGTRFGSGPRAPPVCYNCKMPNHFARDCPELTRRSDRSRSPAPQNRTSATVPSTPQSTSRATSTSQTGNAQ